MSIVKQLEETVNAQISEHEKRPKYQELKSYYEKLKADGLLIPQSYTLPPLDTIGKRLYESTKSKA